ncbi:heterokaryon incompatibility domain-containing protein [Trichoderma ceciliae]
MASKTLSKISSRTKATITSNAYKHFYSPENAAFYNGNHYKQLDQAKKQIRLIQIDPARPSTTSLCFKLHQPISLDNCSSNRFIAISYRAGDPAQTVPISVDGAPFHVFKPLAEALSRASQRLDADEDAPDFASRVYIWADQVCINQSDNAEKAHQVQLMQNIYQSAAGTLAWLGTSPLTSAGIQEFGALSHLGQRFVKMAGKEWDSAERGVKYLETAEHVARSVLPRLDAEGISWPALQALMEDEYWSRGWICQEVLLSRGVSFHTDEQELGQGDFRNALRLMEMFQILLRKYFSIDGELLRLKEDPALNTKDLKPMLAFVNELVWLHKLDLYVHRFFLEDFEEREANGGFDLETIMLHARTCKVSDPLDKAYAFLGITSPRYKLFPDYSDGITSADAYIRAAAAHISTHKSLDMLSFADEKSADSTLPSWTPDWEFSQRTLSLCYRVRGDARAPDASKGLGCEPDFLPDSEGRPNKILECTGIVFDSLDTALGKTANSYSSWEECISCWASHAGVSVQENRTIPNGQEYNALSNETKITAFWSTLCRGIHASEKMRALAMADFKTEPESSTPNTATGPETGEQNHGEKGLLSGHSSILAQILDRDYIRKAGWRFFKSSRGWYGLARSRALPGDQVCLLLGADVPFIIRPSGNDHLLVGEAYVHGMMYGGLIEKTRAVDEARKIRIR